MKKTVLVTGGSGFVAGWCIVQLLQRGYAVRATVRNMRKAAAVRASVAAIVDPGEQLSFCVADLSDDAGWDAAVAGCAYVLHVASPLGGRATDDADALIAPARDGALRVLRAATKAGVERVVLTSSTAAASPPVQSADSVNDETRWTDASDRKLNAYRQSKVLAERAAWDFMEQYRGPTTLTTILPSAVFGPVLTLENLGSVQVIARLLNGKMPGNPRLGFSIVDVRDLADAHIRAMTSSAAAGQRLIAAGQYMWIKEISSALRERLGARAAKVPTRGMPDFVLWLAALFDPALRQVTPGLGHRHSFSSAKATRLLGWTPRPVVQTVVDCAESLLAGQAL